MQLEHKFSVPVPVGEAWDVLLDVERIAPCMPGATVEAFDGETIEGRVKVKVGPIQVTYAGTAKFVEKDESARRAVIDASAKESRGTGTAKASIVAQLVSADAGRATDVTVTTDLAITGKPAQFGRGVMAEVGNKLLGRFADCLAGQLGGEEAPGTTGPGVGETAASSASSASGMTAGTGSEPSTAAAAVAGTTAEVGTPANPEGAPVDPTGKPAGDASASVTRASTQAAAAASSPSAAESVAESVAGQPSARPARPPMRPVDDGDAIDLLDTAGLPVLKRLAPVLGGLLLILLVWRLVARRGD